MDLVSQKAPKNPVVGRLTSDRLSTIDYIIIYVDHEYCNVKCYVYLSFSTIDLGTNEIHAFAIYGTCPHTAILDVNFVQQVLEKTIVWSSIHLT